ncbi:MAG: hypothetical protein LBI15_08815 [Dysgonamonadaceae bacterium]|jgi:hypothetical protein|nr:hypothetical protein [Dysgonamonadaceae bacterium]
MVVTGIKYTKDASGRNRYLRIDLEKYGENQALEDFLDGLEAMALKGGETMPFEDFVKEENRRRGIDV